MGLQSASEERKVYVTIKGKPVSCTDGKDYNIDVIIKTRPEDISVNADG